MKQIYLLMLTLSISVLFAFNANAQLATSLHGMAGPWTDENGGYDWDQVDKVWVGNNKYEPGDTIELLANNVSEDTVYIGIGFFTMNYQGTDKWQFIPGTTAPFDTIFPEEFSDGYGTATYIIPLDMKSTEEMREEYKADGDTSDFWMVQSSTPDYVQFQNHHITIIESSSPPSGIAETYASSELNVYPNPVYKGDMVTVDTEGEIVVYNISGVKVLVPDSPTFSTGDLKPGIYLIETNKSNVSKLLVK